MKKNKIFMLAILTLVLMTGISAQEADPPKIVHLIKFSDQNEFMVDKVIASYIEQSLEQAKDADMVIIEIDTYGGMIIAASRIREAINKYTSETGNKIIAYIPNKAVSAGAAITVACSEIVMKEGAHFGDCAPVTRDPEGGLKMLNDNDKITSVLRKDFETSCKKNGYPYRLGHAMVSQSFASYVLYESSRVKLYSFEELKKLTDEKRKRITGGDVPRRTEFYFPESLKSEIREFSANKDKKEEKKEGPEEKPESENATAEQIIVVIDEVYEVDGDRMCFLSQSPDAERDFTALSPDQETYMKKKHLFQIDSEKRMLELSAEQAYKYHFATKEVKNRQEMYDLYGIDASSVKEIKPSKAENVVRWLNHPMVAGLLIMIGIIAIYAEVNTPGIGVGAAIALLAFGLYFLISFLANDPNYLPMILFLAGIVLILLEVFVIPGFGVAGILGILLVLGGLLTVRLPEEFFTPGKSMEWRFENFTEPFLVVIGGFLSGLIGMVLIARFLPESRFFDRFAVSGPDKLEPVDSAGMRVSTKVVEVQEGDEGTAMTDLRPSGKIEINGEKLNVISAGNYIDKGKTVKVIKVQGNQIKVEEV